MKFLSVIMSVYNGGSYLNAAVESILDQTYSDFEFIIVNNGSTDNTAEVLESYTKKDSRIVVLHNAKTLSYVEGRMKAILHANCEWFANMDADDIAAPQRLEKQRDFILQHKDKLGCVGSWAQYIDSNSAVVGNRRTRPFTVEQFEQMLLNQDAILVTDPSAVINKQLFLDVGGYRVDCAPACDLDLFYRIAERNKLVIAIPEYLLQYRVHSGADSVKKFMLQRLKTHCINYNMRQRRAGLSEVSYSNFRNSIWNKLNYKFPRLWKDYAKALYKESAMLYFEKKHFKMGFRLFLAFLMWPGFVTKRLLSHKFNKGFI